MGVVVLIRKCRARVVEEVRKRYLHQARGKESARGVLRGSGVVCGACSAFSLGVSLVDRKPFLSVSLRVTYHL